MDDERPQFESDRATAWWRWFARRSVLISLAAIFVVAVGIWVIASVNRNVNQDTGADQESLETSLASAKMATNAKGVVTLTTRLIEGQEKGTFTYTDEELADLRLDRGTAYMNLAKYEEAIEDLDEAKNLSKDHTIAALQGEVECRYKLGERKEIIPLYQELIEAVRTSDFPTRNSYIAQYQEYIRLLQTGQELPL